MKKITGFKKVYTYFFKGKVVHAYVFPPFAMKPLNKIWCNQLPSEVT